MNVNESYVDSNIDESEHWRKVHCSDESFIESIENSVDYSSTNGIYTQRDNVKDLLLSYRCGLRVE